MGLPAPRRATYADVLAAPAHQVAEVIDGSLYLHPRPARPHTAAATTLGEELGPPFRRGKGGPGGWILLDEPELHLGDDIVVPDLAGWRRERMPVITTELPYFDLAPDWVCEVLSPSTERVDRIQKLRIYARARVGHVWLVNPILRTLEVLELDGDGWRLLSAHAGDERVSARPFHAIELELGALWADVDLGPDAG
jgi:Uma2 family endonuclease